ncbi:GerW family sporulation protein [Pullulanibacillus sp. KACC 23026]|uniref:GerW family sporulation protein n=1 Tax=Pullulanibacillus sp. KACC 23026 TaxID=3028315 RepID=UPI0023B07453|nr:GerW family sporulation protein [Pullulanibacillus sp. KACC 23026]WEG13882.1 GerW family sporulation protein [Pullulanibacillus sp. KACC 23026]
MGEHPIQGLMKTALESLQEMTDVNTIIGEPIETPDGHVILTVSKVGFGFAAGGSNFKGSKSQEGQKDQESDSSGGGDSLPFGGGSGGGVSITPIAFLIAGPKGIQMIHLDNSTHLFEKMMDLAPQAIDKIQQLMKNKGTGSKGNGGGGLQGNQDDIYN